MCTFFVLNTHNKDIWVFFGGLGQIHYISMSFSNKN